MPFDLYVVNKSRFSEEQRVLARKYIFELHTSSIGKVSFFFFHGNIQFLPSLLIQIHGISAKVLPPPLYPSNSHQDIQVLTSLHSCFKPLSHLILLCMPFFLLGEKAGENYDDLFCAWSHRESFLTPIFHIAYVS